MTTATFIPTLPITTRKFKRPHPRMSSSTRPPDFFPTHLFHRTTPTPLSLSLSAHHIPTDNSTDRHLIHPSNILALIDHPNPDPILSDLRRLLDSNHPLYTHQPSHTLSRILSTLLKSHIHPSFSALLADCSSNVVRLAWTGICGFVLIRDARVIHRSYTRLPARQALEHVLDPPTLPQIQTEFLELQDNDLLIMGSDGLFANLSEEQILAFVRPVPDGPEDRTLGLANATCLGSWRTDDVDFIAYYLSFLAANFATADHSRPVLSFPFPPSPHVDDVTVMCAACEFG